MFGRKNRQKPQNNLIEKIMNIVTIADTSITCIGLAYNDILSVKLAAAIMIGVVVFVAIGNNFAKIILVCASLFLFLMYYSQGNHEYFTLLLTQILTLIIVLIGLYIMIRGVFR